MKKKVLLIQINILLFEINYELINSYKNTIVSYKYKLHENSEIIPVLTYHRIVNDWEKKKVKYRHSSLALSRSIFKLQMKFLKNKGYKTLNCTELYLWHKGKIKLPKKSVFDDGSIGQEKYAIPILKKYNFKATAFIIGKLTLNNEKGTIKYNRIPKLNKLYPKFDFESHTFDLHIHLEKNIYNKTYKDAVNQNQYFNFSFLAYPYGNFSSEMIRAYKEIGIKMAFTYGKNRYANRNQSIYMIRRIKINANEDFSKFTRWFKS
jgi:peptidoglycan/xylan/chitin deacetylase (PgdA/CDA1 family)